MIAGERSVGKRIGLEVCFIKTRNILPIDGQNLKGMPKIESYWMQNFCPLFFAFSRLGCSDKIFSVILLTFP